MKKKNLIIETDKEQVFNTNNQQNFIPNYSYNTQINYSNNQFNQYNIRQSFTSNNQEIKKQKSNHQSKKHAFRNIITEYDNYNNSKYKTSINEEKNPTQNSLPLTSNKYNITEVLQNFKNHKKKAQKSKSPSEEDMRKRFINIYNTPPQNTELNPYTISFSSQENKKTRAIFSNNSCGVFSNIFTTIKNIENSLQNNSNNQSCLTYIFINQKPGYRQGNNYYCSSKKKYNGVESIATVKYNHNVKKREIVITEIIPINNRIILNDQRVIEAIGAIENHQLENSSTQNVDTNISGCVNRIDENFRLKRIPRKEVKIATINNYIATFEELKNLESKFNQLTIIPTTPKNQRNSAPRHDYNKITAQTQENTYKNSLINIIRKKQAFIEYLSKYYNTTNLQENEDKTFPICFQPQFLSDEILIEGTDKFFTTFQQEYINQIKNQLNGKNTKPTIICGPPGSGKTDLINFITNQDNLTETKQLLGIDETKEIKFLHLDYSLFYNYNEAGMPIAKSEEDIKNIIDNKINTLQPQNLGSKTFLFVDEWGVMYPPEAINYLEKKQLELVGTLAIIGATAHQKPIEALLKNEESKFFSHTSNIQHINPNIFSENINTEPAKYEFIVDFTREINNYKKLTDYINQDIIALPENEDNFILVSQYKESLTGENKYMMAQKANSLNAEIISNQNFIGTPNTKQNNQYHSFTQEQMLNKLAGLRTRNGGKKIIYHYSHSVARGGDIGLIPEGDAIKYKIITNDNSSVNFSDNLIQALSRNRSFRNEFLYDKNTKLNIEIFHRNSSNHQLTKYLDSEIKEKINQRNNFFDTTQNEAQHIEFKHFEHKEEKQSDISDVDKQELQNEIEKIINQQDEDSISKKEFIDIAINYLDFINNCNLQNINKEESIKNFISQNENIPNFKECVGYAKAIRRIDINYQHKLFKPIPETSITLNNQEIGVSSSTIYPKIIFSQGKASCQYYQKIIDTSSQYQHQPIPPILLESTNQNNNSIEIPLEFTGKQETITGRNNSQQFSDVSLQNEEVSNIEGTTTLRFENLLNISQNPSTNNQQSSNNSSNNFAIIGALAVGLLGGACYYFRNDISNWLPDNTAGTSNTSSINPLINAGADNLKSDSSSYAKSYNYGGNNHVNNISSINNHQHSASLIGKSHGLSHLGTAKTAHFSFASSATSKLGLATKAGILAGSFTPLLAVAGIATAGYLGYKAFEYYYKQNNEEIANEEPSINNIKTINYKALKETELKR